MTRWTACQLIMFAALAAAASAQIDDVSSLARFKDYKALRESSNNQDPASNDDSKRVIPGETAVLADLQGPGEITHIWLTIAANEYAWPRLVRLRVYYDGSSIPSVDAPVGDFFAVGHGQERSVNSLMIRNTANGRSRNSYWTMPFRQSCKITITNEGLRRVQSLYYHVDWRKLPSLPKDVGYFHARYRQYLPALSGQQLQFASLKGRGHYVGTVFSVVQTQPGWFGEGDERVYVDGSTKPVIEGTGSEDYFNDAWSLRVAEGAYTGVPVAEGTSFEGSRMTAYRWHIKDPIPFSHALDFDMEHAGWTYRPDGRVRSGFEERADYFSLVAFWYQEGIARDQPELPFGPARLPLGNAQQIEAEDTIDTVTAEGGRPSVQKEVFWSRDILHFQAATAAATFSTRFTIEESGRYELLAQIAHAPDYGIYEVSLDGKPLSAEIQLEHEPGANEGAGARIDAYNSELYVAEDHLLGWRQLAKGQHTLSFRCAGKNQLSSGYNLGIDTFILSRIGRITDTGGSLASDLRRLGEQGQINSRVKQSLEADDPFVRRAAVWAFTQAPKAVGGAESALAKALSDPDPTVRGLAAVAFRNCGPCAEAAINELTVCVKDSDPNVRIASADAMAHLGPKGLPALESLIAAGGQPGEHPHVLRSIAAAIGAIGPSAGQALPLLEHMAENIRVRGAARAAIARIKRQAPPLGPESPP